MQLLVAGCAPLSHAAGRSPRIALVVGHCVEEAIHFVALDGACLMNLDVFFLDRCFSHYEIFSYSFLISLATCVVFF